jgi:glycosyltransferase involved in cell wall biosynthesis
VVGRTAGANAVSQPDIGPPTISVVIPTHDRSEALRRLLIALRDQTSTADDFEVVVVADGCQDQTVAKVRNEHWPFRLKILEQPAAGAATARNRGAERSSADVLLFLDDDVEPEPNLLRAHLALHAQHEAVVGLGDLRPAIPQDSFFDIALRGWWDEMSARMREHGHRYSCFDLLSGHFSIRRQDFKALGGFDSTLRCREDYELGYRVSAAGLTFRLVRGTSATHHETSDLAKVMRRKFDEGVADVGLCERHPALADALPLRRETINSRLTPLFHWLAWHQPAIGDALAWCVTRTLPFYEFWRLRYRWRVRIEDLLSYWYWRGVATATGSRVRLAALLAKRPDQRDSSVTIDLAAGFEAAEAKLDRLRPAAMRLVYAEHFIGELKEVPGAEPLRGIHLRRIIARRFADEYLRAVVLAGAVPEILLNPALEQALSSKSPSITPR